MKVSELTGKPIPPPELERGRCMDLISDSHAWLHGKKFALYGDPDFVMGMVNRSCWKWARADPHPSPTTPTSAGARLCRSCSTSSPFGKLGKVYVGNDLWHMRPVSSRTSPDFRSATPTASTSSATPSTRVKSSVPLIRIGFPIFDRHHQHRATTLGYEGDDVRGHQLTNAVRKATLDKETSAWAPPTTTSDLVR